MDKQDLLKKVSMLKQAAEDMDEPDKTFKLDDVSQMKIAIESMSISDIAQKMQQIDTPKIQEIDDSIQLALQATASHSQRVHAFNKAYGVIKGAIKLAI